LPTAKVSNVDLARSIERQLYGTSAVKILSAARKLPPVSARSWSSPGNEIIGTLPTFRRTPD
jgi:hypothetical protein